MQRKIEISGIQAYHVQVYFKAGDRDEFHSAQTLWREIKTLSIERLIDNEVIKRLHGETFYSDYIGR